MPRRTMAEDALRHLRHLQLALWRASLARVRRSVFGGGVYLELFVPCLAFVLIAVLTPRNTSLPSQNEWGAWPTTTASAATLETCTIFGTQVENLCSNALTEGERIHYYTYGLQGDDSVFTELMASACEDKACTPVRGTPPIPRAQYDAKPALAVAFTRTANATTYAIEWWRTPGNDHIAAEAKLLSLLARLQHASKRSQQTAQPRRILVTPPNPSSPAYTSSSYRFVRGFLPLGVAVTWLYSGAMAVVGFVGERRSGAEAAMLQMGLPPIAHAVGQLADALLFLCISVMFAGMTTTEFGAEIFMGDHGCVLCVNLFSAIAATMQSFALAEVLGARCDTATSAACASGLWLVSHLPYTAFTSSASSSPMIRPLKTIFSLLPASAVGFGIETLAAWGAAGEAATWKNASQQPPTFQAISLNAVLSMLALDIFLYGTLAWHFRLKRVRRTVHVAVAEGDDGAEIGADEEVARERIGIQVSRLRVEYNKGDVVAVKSLSLDVAYGSVTGLLGHNGAGKSSTVAAICGALAPTSGAVNVCMHRAGTQQAATVLGVCPQHEALWPELTVRDHMLFQYYLKDPLSTKSRLQVREEIDAALREVKLLSKDMSQAKTLSGGMRRRLLVALAFLGKDTRAVVLDEPTAGCDPRSRRLIEEVVDRNKRRGVAILLATHHLDEADRLADEVSVLENGQLRCLGHPEELKRLFKAPHTLTVQLANGIPSAKDEILRVLRLCVPNTEEQLHIPHGQDEACFALPSTTTSHALRDALSRMGRLPAVVNYSLDAPNLAGVFHALAANSSSESGGIKVADIKTPTAPSSSSHDTTTAWRRQTKALLSAMNQAAAREGWIGRTLLIILPAILFASAIAVLRGLPRHTSAEWSNELAWLSSSQHQATTAAAVLLDVNVPFNTTSVDTTAATFAAHVGTWTAYQRGTASDAIAAAKLAVATKSVGGGDAVLWRGWKAPDGAMLSLVHALFGGSSTSTTPEPPPRQSMLIPPLRRDAEKRRLRILRRGDSSPRLATLAATLALASALPPSALGSRFARLRESGLRRVLAVAGLRRAPLWIATSTSALQVLSMWWLVALVVALAGAPSATCGLRLASLVISHSISSTTISHGFSILMSRSSETFITSAGVDIAIGLGSAGMILTIESNADKLVEPMLVHLLGILPGFSLVYGCCDVVLDDLAGTRTEEMTVVFVATQVAVATFVGALCFMFEGGGGRGGGGSVVDDESGGGGGSVVEDEDEEVGIAGLGVKGERARLMSQSASDHLQLHGLTKKYGRFTAVHDLWLGLATTGGVTGLLGINGCGKSSTFKMITGDTRATSGRFRRPRIMGYCPQTDAALETLTVAEHLELIAGVRGVDEVSAHIQHQIASVGLDGMHDVQAHALSGGNRRKMNLAMAMNGSAVLLLDEPTAGVDPIARVHVRAAIRRASAHASILLTTHSVEDACELCTRVGLMSLGKLHAIGTPRALRTQHAHGELRVSCVFLVRAVPTTLGTLLTLEEAHISGERASWALQKTRVDIPNLVHALEEARVSGILRAWSISEPSLEEVVLEVGGDGDEARMEEELRRQEAMIAHYHSLTAAGARGEPVKRFGMMDGEGGASERAR